MRYFGGAVGGSRNSTSPEEVTSAISQPRRPGRATFPPRCRSWIPTRTDSGGTPFSSEIRSRRVETAELGERRVSRLEEGDQRPLAGLKLIGDGAAQIFQPRPVPLSEAMSSFAGEIDEGSLVW